MRVMIRDIIREAPTLLLLPDHMQAHRALKAVLGKRSKETVMAAAQPNL
jgi:hypothetical protein